MKKLLPLIAVFAAVVIILQFYLPGNMKSFDAPFKHPENGTGNSGLDTLDTNGKIVEKTRIALGKAYSDKVEAFRIKYISDGLKVVGFLLNPKNTDKKYPVMIFNRGGAEDYGKITEGESLNNLCFFAAKGYVVLASQYRGNDGGEGNEEFGGSDVNDVLNLVPLAKSLAYTDMNNVFMYGVSRGGMMTYLAIKKGVKLNAACVVGGLSDNFDAYYDIAYPPAELYIKLTGTDPVAGRDEFIRRSAIYWPESIDIPVLILHGSADSIINIRQARSLASSLERLGREFKFIEYPFGDHLLTNYKSQRDNEILDWFGKYMK